MARSPVPAAARPVVAAGCLVVMACVTAAQSPAVEISDGLIRVRPAGIRLLDAASIERLKVGALVQLDVSFAVLASRNGPAIARRADSFRVSYDLWEERFAVTRSGPPARSALHATEQRLDAWCLAQLAVPVADLTALAPRAPFWIRLESSTDLPERRTADEEIDDPFLISALIDRLSRRRSERSAPRLIEAGPFPLTP